MTRREYNREYAYRRRREQLDAARQQAKRCPRGHGQGVCGCLLQRTVLRDGSVSVRCPWCERREAGICRDCPAPVEGAIRRAIRCARCKERARTMYVKRYHARHQETVNRKARLYQRRHATESAAYKRRWRKLNRDKTAAQKRRHYERHRDNIAAYQEAYRERHKGVVPVGPRTCVSPGCRIRMRGRAKKCCVCKLREQREAQQWAGAA